MDSDDDVEVTGAAGFDALRSAPHARGDCLVHKMATTNAEMHCPHCYCFVCDVPAGDCKEWTSHCQATAAAPRWVALRAQHKRRKETEDLAAQRQQHRRQPRPAGDAHQETQRFTYQHQQDSEMAEEEEAEELFALARPRWFIHGADHPDPCVETTSLSFVDPPCPQLPVAGAAPAQLPNILGPAARHKSLSSLQLEAIMYADARHQTQLPGRAGRGGFFLGDGPGVGKGRQMAGLIVENWLQGRRRHIWFSVSPDLCHDARRDLDDILRAHAMDARDLPIYNLSKLNYRDIDKEAGVIFCTYANLVSHEGEKAAERDKQNAALERDAAAAAAAAGAKRTRLAQLVKWFKGGGADGVVVFDESHKAKNLMAGAGGGGGGTKTATAVMSLQEQLPDARIVYCSATGASSVKNMAYMSRLGLWGPGTCFTSFGEFDKAIERSGYGGMELVALDMKQRGSYLCRTLSYRDATFETVEIELAAPDAKMYNDCAAFWQTMLECFRHAIDELSAVPGWKPPKHAMSQFWGAHQRFFKQLCMAMKVGAVVAIAQKARAEGKCVIIGLQSTGEARLAEALANAGEDGLEDFRGLLAIVENLLETQFPTLGELDDGDGDGEGSDPDAPVLAGDAPARGGKAKAEAKAGGAVRASSSRAGAGAGASAAAGAALGLSDDESSDDDFTGEAAAEAAATAAMQRTLRAMPDGALTLALEAMGVKKWKGGKERDARVQRLHGEYRTLWRLGKTQLKRKLVELGARAKCLPVDKRALVDKLWRRSLRHQWRLWEEAEVLPEGLQRLPAAAQSDDDAGDASDASDDEAPMQVGAHARQMLTTGRLSEIRRELLREAQSLTAGLESGRRSLTT